MKKTVIAVFILSLLLSVSVNADVHKLKNISNSMAPTISEQDEICVVDYDRQFPIVIGGGIFFKSYSEVERYDVIVFRWPDDASEFMVKRVIGLPGETVKITEEGKVYIGDSDVPLNDDFILEPMTWSFTSTYEVPEKSYFVLGDNRNNSKDSRFWENTFVKRGYICGKVIANYTDGTFIE